MEIDANISGVKHFEDLVGGDTFYYAPSGTMWIKLIHPIYEYTAVALDDGTPIMFNDDDDVIYIHTKLVNA